MITSIIVSLLFFVISILWDDLVEGFWIGWNKAKEDDESN